MDYIDLVSLLKAYNGSIKNVRVFGKVVSRLKRPTNLQPNIVEEAGGMFVRVEVFAIDLSYIESYLRDYGYKAPDNIYMVNGSLVTYLVQGNHKFPDWYEIEGTLRSGKKGVFNYMCMYNFKKDDSTWHLNGSRYCDINQNTWIDDSICHLYINKCRDTNVICQPDEVKLLQPFFATDRSEIKPTSLAGEMQKYQNNVEITNVTSKFTSKFKKCNRRRIEPKSDVVKKVEDIVKQSKSATYAFISSLKTDYYDSDYCTSYVKDIIDAINVNFRNKPVPEALTGRAIVKKYLSNYKGLDESYLGRTVGEYLLDIFQEIGCFMKFQDEVNADGKAWKVCRQAFGNPEKFYAGVLAVLLGVSQDEMFSMQETCELNELSFSMILNENPYLLQIICGTSFETIEYIALALGKSNDSSLTKYRNIALINAYITDSNQSNTVFRKDSLERSTLGITLTKAKYDSVRANGHYFSKVVFANINNYIRRINSNCYDYRAFKYDYDSKGYVQQIPRAEVNTAISDYVEVGLGVSYDNLITSTKLAEKEVFVYNFMYDLGEKETGYNSEDIDKYIKEYEDEIGFKLEPEQVQAVHLLEVMAGAVAGSAGSGKTTTSNCMVYVLEHLEPNISMKFATPTGKAAKRMQEVVKRPVKTMNSMFKVGEVSDNLFDSDDLSTDYTDTVYFFDENAMVTIDLLYSVLKCISYGSRIYLFGDFNQLPPIGKGLPFKNLLRFLPCVFLSVSKRAKDGSNITNVSNIINDYSESSNWKDIPSGQDFFLLPCNEDTIKDSCVALVRHYLGKETDNDKALLNKMFNGVTLPERDDLTPDDIQVVSPIGKATYSWGTFQMNRVLQPIFNNTRGYKNTFVNQKVEGGGFSKFVLGDRVIHSKNMYSMQWYSTYKNGDFTKMYGYGICNGDVGKIVAFYPAQSCTFNKEVGSAPDDFEYPDNLRNDETFDGANDYFIVVEYFDYMSDSNFYILYRCTENSFSNNIGISLRGEDLDLIQLFYAGTVHKLQGSQAKLIINLLGVVNFNGFITRNMCYTGVTRAEWLEFMIGSVGNERTSQLSRARCVVAGEDIMTLGEVFCEGVE